MHFTQDLENILLIRPFSATGEETTAVAAALEQIVDATPLMTPLLPLTRLAASADKILFMDGKKSVRPEANHNSFFFLKKISFIG